VPGTEALLAELAANRIVNRRQVVGVDTAVQFSAIAAGECLLAGVNHFFRDLKRETAGVDFLAEPVGRIEIRPKHRFGKFVRGRAFGGELTWRFDDAFRKFDRTGATP